VIHVFFILFVHCYSRRHSTHVNHQPSSPIVFPRVRGLRLRECKSLEDNKTQTQISNIKPYFLNQTKTDIFVPFMPCQNVQNFPQIFSKTHFNSNPSLKPKPFSLSLPQTIHTLLQFHPKSSNQQPLLTNGVLTN
jgi:hypothetical protein